MKKLILPLQIMCIAHANGDYEGALRTVSPKGIV